MKAVVFGASGYAGVELVRIIDAHPNLELVGVSASSNAGATLAELFPHLRDCSGADLVLLENSALVSLALEHQIDVAFMALPHNHAVSLAPLLLGHVKVVVDLSADFRLKDAALYETAYGFEHPAPHLLGDAVYGLVELNRSALLHANLIAAPGCYVTAATLALFPLLEAGALSRKGLIVSALSGVSGAGRAADVANLFGEVDSNVMAYGLSGHRHRPEIEQNLGAQVLFVPHLVPMTRGLLATCYGELSPEFALGNHTSRSSKMVVEDHLSGILEDFYVKDPFICVLAPGTSPRTKSTIGTNAAHISLSYDVETNQVVIICALDNMVKGASGQAIQAANISLGLSESDGLTKVGIYP